MRQTAALFLVFLVLAGCLSSGSGDESAVASTPPAAAAAENGESNDTAGEIKEDTILEIAGQEPEAAAFIIRNPDYTASVTALEPKDLAVLAEKYPVVYAGLPEGKTLYRVDYHAGDRGMLVIVDPDRKEVLRYFSTTGITLG